ncbi:MAG: hypothetical protein ABFC57_03345 [Veillonellales bacterium]
MQAVKELQEYGYTFTVHDGKIHYKFMGPGKLDESRVMPLLEQIRDNKAAAMSYLLAGQAKGPVRSNNIRFMPQVQEQAAALVDAIRGKALSLGWKPEQLDELQHGLRIWLPCRIGTVTLQAIEIQTLYPDGKSRGSLHHYNMQTDQPWIKRMGAG